MFGNRNRRTASQAQVPTVNMSSRNTNFLASHDSFENTNEDDSAQNMDDGRNKCRNCLTVNIASATQC